MVVRNTVVRTVWTCWCLVIVAVIRGVDPVASTPLLEDDLGLLLQQVLAAVDRTVAFFQDDYSKLNLDGVVCVRVCEAALTDSLSDCEVNSWPCPPELTRSLQKLVVRLEQIAVDAISNIQVTEPEYYSSFRKMTESPFSMKYKPLPLEQASLPIFSEETYEYPLYGSCVAALLGGAVGNISFAECTIRDGCLSLVTENNTTGYYVTHQLLYLIMTTHFGCQEKVEPILLEETGKSVQVLVKELCQKIYQDASVLAQGNRVDMRKQDLFMEQIMFCGMMGYREFFLRQWITLVLSWQTERGCYSNKNDLVEDALVPVNLTSENQTTYNSRDIEGRWTRRKLLTEKEMSDGCLSHKTGLALGSMGLFIRHLIRELYSR